MSIELSETDLIRVVSDAAESFTDAFYTALNAARDSLKGYYVLNQEVVPGRLVPHISYNGELLNDASVFQKRFADMPYTFYDAQSVDAHVLNPRIDPEGSKTQKDAEHNLSISVMVAGVVRLLERQEGPIRAFSDHLVLVPNKETAGGKGTGKTGEGRQWLIQTQNFRFVT